jgi:hypothetical protein
MSDLLPKLWAAFPKGYFAKSGTKALCGATLVSLPGGTAWVLSPQMSGDGSARLAPADTASGDSKVQELRRGLQLLPDVKDVGTLTMMRELLASRADVDSTYGITWAPRAKGREFLGWTISSPMKSRWISATLVPSTDPVVSILEAIKATNCTCSEGGERKKCPEHGTKPWNH